MVTRDELLEQARAARRRTADRLRHTPLEPSAGLSELCGVPVYLKLENLQLTGAFKPRGPLNLLLRLPPEERRRGVVAPTGGNHGLGLAWAAAQVGTVAHIFLPKNADPDKVRRLREFGARLTFCDDYEAAHHAAVDAASSTGARYVSPYNDPDVIAADGVVGLEIRDDLPEVRCVIACLGGGGLVAGIAAVLKALDPAVVVKAVEAAASPTFSTWSRAGAPCDVDIGPTIAEGLGGYVEPDTLSWPLISRDVDEVLSVSDDELISAMRWLVEQHRLIVEPSGAAAVAALLRTPALASGPCVATITGGNVGWPRFLGLVAPDRVL